MLSTLDTPDIATIQTCFMSKLFLRQAEFAPLRANAFSENGEIGIHRPMSREGDYYSTAY